ncbi:HlyD family secretion protein [Xenophilus sp. Marseille-Q4582]|uniref:HlyD family secretion protein n=1 Tax=Xenophilus sp. Marseille-Q4582 TaxID=2866600 RepID=UPI001CE40F5B|nr:HlyD family efflux transporter periplasmic adaptor subunit [Xenophilus sp. Marseille-Q4582]
MNEHENNGKRPGLGVIAGILLVAGLLGWGLWQASRPAPEPIQGQMEAQETDVAGKVTGRVAELKVREGERIEAGSLLLRLDAPEVAAKMAQARAAEEAAQAVARKAEHGARPQEVEMARMQWQRAQTAAELARTSFVRVDNLAREGLVARQKRDEAEANWKASRDAAAAARAQYDMARQGARTEDRDAAAAQARQVGGMVQEVEAARAETELRSPVAGEVAKVLARVGELLPQGVAALTVVDLQDQWVVLNVREDRLSRFAMGSEFDARLPALGEDARARFKVSYSAPLPDFATWRATRAGSGFDMRTFEVRARPLQPIEGARPGMSVLVD